MFILVLRQGGCGVILVLEVLMSKYMRGTPTERFFAKVSKNHDGCWVWCGCKNPAGYGRMNVDGKAVLAHRWIYQHINNIQLPRSVDVDHICRNKACVNPEHLRSASRSENQMNTEKHKDNTSGFKGVDYHRGTGKWRARVGAKHLGLYTTPEDAYKAYCDAASEAFGEFWIP